MIKFPNGYMTIKNIYKKKWRKRNWAHGRISMGQLRRKLFRIHIRSSTEHWQRNFVKYPKKEYTYMSGCSRKNNKLLQQIKLLSHYNYKLQKLLFNLLKYSN